MAIITSTPVNHIPVTVPTSVPVHPLAFTPTWSSTTPSSPNPNGLSSTQLLASAECFMRALSTCTPPLSLLTYFSTTSPVTLLHCPAACPHPWTSLLVGPNAVRSYFDLLATHWTRSQLSAPPELIRADSETRIVTIRGASMRWTWRASGRSWTEEFTCILGFDELGKIMRFEVRTEGEPGTCVMHAVDVDKKTTVQPSAAANPAIRKNNSNSAFGDAQEDFAMALFA